MQNTVNPLNWNVPIVDPAGRPTPEFQQKWVQQGKMNGAIPDLSAAAAHSVLLGTGAQSVGSAGPGSSGQVLIAQPSANPAFATISGDLTLSYTGTATLAASGVTAGTYGDSTHYVIVTVDAKGRVTSASQAAFSATGDVVGPGSAVNNHVVFFDGTTGKLIKDSGLTLSGTNTGDQTISDATITTTDITTNNVTSSKHGFAPKAPADATKFLNGAATPAYAAVKDSDLSTSDITTNDVSSTKHGLAPKSAADATKFLNSAATPAYAQVKDSDLSTSDITTNNVSTSKHGFAPKLPNDATKFMDGTGAYSTPSGSSGAMPMASGDTSAPTAVFDPQGQFIAAGSSTSGRSITNYMAAAAAASRPSTPDVGTGAISLFWSTDTHVFSVSASGSWHTP